MQLARRSKQIGLLDYSAALQERHEAATSAEARKEKGQVFTPAGVCRFMASRFMRIPERFRVLDPGAGIGSLSAAVCERVMTLASPRRVELVLFENDAVQLPLLFMARAAELLKPNGEMVAITPRSFCNGLYFRNFRLDGVMAPFVAASGSFALLGFPNHSNVGDSAIWVGETEYLGRE